MIDWQLIETHPIPTDDYAETPPSVLVDNGTHIGEAVLKQDYGAWEGDDESPPFRWAWTHRSTCSCCHSFMEPQPTHWAAMPTRSKT